MIYLFVDGLAERLHLGQPREVVLAAWGVRCCCTWHRAARRRRRAATRVLPRPAPARPTRSAADRLRRRPGLIRAIEERFPRSARQRCLAHKLCNLQSKMPKDQWPEFKARAIACYQAASPVLARMLRDDIAATYGAAVPSALACL